MSEIDPSFDSRPRSRQYAKCDWCGQVTRVANRAEADRWLRTHDCQEAVRDA